MENTDDSGSFKITQLTAISAAKILTILLLVAFAWIFGIQNRRQVLYLGLHIAYCVWWLVEQSFYPQRRQQLLRKPVGLAGFIFSLLLVGSLYAIPGYVAFINPEPLSLTAIALALPLFIVGSLISTSADTQQLTAEEDEAGVDGLWRFARIKSYFGNLLRYLGFSLVAGSIWAYLAPAIVALIYLQRTFRKEQAMLQQNQGYKEFDNRALT